MKLKKDSTQILKPSMTSAILYMKQDAIKIKQKIKTIKYKKRIWEF